MTFDAMSNSPSHSQLNTRKFGRRIWLFIRSHLRFFSRHPCNYIGFLTDLLLNVENKTHVGEIGCNVYGK